MTNTIYSSLEYDPFAVAHRLNMPAALFEAFKKAMIGGLRGAKTQHQDYQEAIICLRRFHTDYLHGFVAMPEGHEFNNEFIDDVEASYEQNWMLRLENQNSEQRRCNDREFTTLSNAHYAGAEILNWFKSDCLFEEQSSALIAEAITYLETALACLNAIADKSANPA